MGSFFAAGDAGVDILNTALVQEAYRIGKDVHKRTLHVSPWINCIKQTSFPDGMGHTLTTLLYDRALPTTDTTGSTRGVNWHALANLEDTLSLNTSLIQGAQPLIAATESTVGPSGVPAGTSGKSYLNLARRLKSHYLKRAIIESPKISLEDLRFAAYREEQIRAIVDLMSEASRYTWEERYRDEYDAAVDNFVLCKSASTSIVTGQEGVQTWNYDVSTDGTNSDITANISNAILDRIYMQLVRRGAGANAWGRENARPIFALVCSSEASLFLQREAGIRDDVRYNNAVVDQLIAPLGVEKSFRGFYHLIDDLLPRYSFNASSDQLDRVDPYSISSGIVSDNASYDTASYEVAYVLHKEVMESQVPNPFSGTSAIKFDPVNYRGEFKWTNIKDMDRNPDGTVGFFRAILANASKLLKTDFGYAILFKRDTTTVAA